MDQKDILETVICEMTERALAIRRETCEEAEQQLYKKASAVSYRITCNNGNQRTLINP